MKTNLKIEESMEFKTISDLEELENGRFELIDGVIYAMASPSPEHGILSSSLSSLLSIAFKGKSCWILSDSMSIKTKDEIGDRVLIPDIGVVCSPIDEEDGYFKNPSIVIEILSPSTALKDRSTKLYSYMNIPSIEAYLCVEQSMIRIDCYRRVDGEIRQSVFKKGHTIPINENISLEVDDIYRKVLEYRDNKNASV